MVSLAWSAGVVSWPSSMTRPAVAGIDGIAYGSTTVDEGGAQGFLQESLPDSVGAGALVVPRGLESAVFERGVEVLSLAQDFEIAGTGDAAFRLIALARGEVFEEVFDTQRRR